jgi:hypothetical protein
MSWIIQSLLNDKNFIKETNDISADGYNDLLLIEKAISDLEKNGVLSKTDLEIISDMTGDVPGFDDKPKSIKETEFKRYVSICERIAYFMGGYFTDEGYLSYMSRKYRLTEEQVQVLQNYIKSPFKHRIMRKTSPVGYSYKTTVQGNDNDK